jgi:hypothetical protein
MEIKEAMDNLLNSPVFKEKAKEKNKDGGKLRMFVSRYHKGKASLGNVVSLLDEFGYEIEVKNSNKK